jgi:hypothetical protein
MKSNAQLRALAPIVIGLLGMGGYQVILHLKHPIMMENDLFHGIWFGACFGLEITGLYLHFKNKSGSTA